MTLAASGAQHHGEVFTRRWVVEVLLDLTGYTTDRDLGSLVEHADFLLPEADDSAADVVIGNPPYIRYDDLSDDLAIRYRSTWPTMRGRGDIYVGFIERSLRLLKPRGKVGFICADRWVRNQYGADLRELVARDYAVEHVWTMHDVDAFEAEVAAYPAIIVLYYVISDSWDIEVLVGMNSPPA